MIELKHVLNCLIWGQSAENTVGGSLGYSAKPDTIQAIMA